MMEELKFRSVKDALNEGVDVVAMFGGNVGLDDDLEYVRDVGIDAWVKVERYYVPKFVFEVFKEGGNIYNDILLTWIEKYVEGGLNTEKWKLKRVFHLWEDNKKFTCGSYVSKTCVECGIEYIVRHPCKREWCPDCGTPGSLYHKERYVKALLYAFVMFLNAGRVGYPVITCPLELREQWKSKQALNKVKSDVVEIMKKFGFEYGFWQWHFAGETGVFYPHLNVLLPWGYIEEDKYEMLKEEIRKRLGVKVVYYQYAKEIERIKHMVYYITRPTWNLQSELNPEEWKRFRKNGIWGRKHFKKDEGVQELLYQVMFKRGKVENTKVKEDSGELEDVLRYLFSLRNSKCPVCSGELKGKYFRGYKGKLIKGDVYRLGWHLWLIALPKKQKRGKQKEVEYGE
jgi:hypothetical protein